jgi:hypothetical protein
VAREVANEVANKVRAWLELYGTFITFARGALSGITGKLDAADAAARESLDKLATADAKLDVATGKLDSANAKLDAAHGKLDALHAVATGTAAAVEQLAASQNRKAHLGWMLVFALALAFVYGRRDRPESNCTETASVTQPPAVANAVNGATSEAAALLRAALGHLLDLGKKSGEEHWIPKEPASWQKLAKDCNPRQGETAINGGCWVKVADMEPPCGEIFRHGNACYRPVAADPLKPVGMAPDAPGQQ